MFCNRCGAPNPDGSAFCFKCGSPMAAGAGGGMPGAPPPPPPPPPPTMDIKNLKCSACGAPFHLDGPIQVVTCEYCGSTIALSGTGWKDIKAHSMLIPKVIDQNGAMAACKAWMDRGLFHHDTYNKAKLLEAKCQVVPYWIVASSAVSNFTYQDVAAQAGMMGAGIGAGALLGAAMGGRGFAVVPVMGGGTAAQRAGNISGQYQFPVIAVKGLETYQPKEYQFDLTTRVPYDKRKLPGGLNVLNGDVGEDDAKNMAKALVSNLQLTRAHAQHHMIQKIDTQVNIGDCELLHAPVWYLNFELHNGKKEMIVVDAGRNAVMNVPPPSK